MHSTVLPAEHRRRKRHLPPSCLVSYLSNNRRSLDSTKEGWIGSRFHSAPLRCLLPRVPPLHALPLPRTEASLEFLEFLEYRPIRGVLRPGSEPSAQQSTDMYIYLVSRLTASPVVTTHPLSRTTSAQAKYGTNKGGESYLEETYARSG